MYQDERNALLKYFYLIDTERLAENVNDKLHHSTAPGEMFQVMFSEIKKTCEKYIEFIWSPYSFNYPGSSREVKAPSYSFDEILKNHCILHGFQSAVKEKADGSIKISGGKDSQYLTIAIPIKPFSRNIMNTNIVSTIIPIPTHTAF